MDRLFTSLQNGLFGTFYVLSKEPTSLTPGKAAPSSAPAVNKRGHLQLVAQCISLLQMLSFCSSSILRWSVLPSMAWLRDITFGLSLQSILSPTLQLAAFYIALIWATMFILLFFWAMRCFVLSSFPVLWPLKLLRHVCGVTVSVLYIPTLTSLLHVYTCGTNEQSREAWVSSTGQCYTEGHLAHATVAGIIAVQLVVLSCMFALMFTGLQSDKQSILARLHGRADLIFILIKSILVVFVQSFPDVLGPYGVIALLLSTGVVWLASLLYWMPFTVHLSNQVNVAMASVFAACSFMCLLAQLVPHYDAGIGFAVAGPMAAIVGVMLANLRAKLAFYLPVSSVLWDVDIELKARYTMHFIMFGHHTDRMPFNPSLLYAPEPPQQLPHATTGYLAASGVGRATVTANAAVPGDVNIDFTGLTGENASHYGRPENTSLLTNAMPNIAARVYTPTKAQLACIEEIYRSGLERFADSAFLHICTSKYYAEHRNNRHLSMKHILAAERSSPAFDVGFQIYVARRTQEDTSGMKGQMSAMNRVFFEKYLADAKAKMRAVADAQLSLWNELLEEVPNAYKLHSASYAMYTAEEVAEKAFAQLLALNPQSLLVMRLYGDFCLRLKNDKEKADLLFADADRTEETSKKELAKVADAHMPMMAASELDIMSDDTGILHVSAGGATLGSITRVSAHACRLLGYSRWQLERRNVSCIVPGILGKAHDGFMRKYVATGETTVVDYTRTLFALHKSGYLVPVLLSIKETTSEDGSPEFVGIMRGLHLSEEFILLTDTFSIIGCTMRSLSVLQLEGSSVASNDLSLLEWAPEIPGLMNDLREGKGAALFFDCARARAAIDGEHHASSSSHSIERGEEESHENSRWVKARLQEAPLSDGTRLYVLAWSALSEDDTTLRRAAAKRQAALAKTQFAASGVTVIPPPAAKPHIPLPPGHKNVAGEGKESGNGSCPFLFSLPNQPEGDADALLAALNLGSPVNVQHKTVLQTDARSDGPENSADTGSEVREMVQPKRLSIAAPRAMVTIRDVGERNSTHSKSDESVRRMQLLRNSLEEKNFKLLPPIQVMRTTGIIATIVSIVLALVIIILSATKYAEYGRSIDAVMQAADVLTAGLRIGLITREFAVAAAGFITMHPGYIGYLFTQMGFDIEVFSSHLRELYDLAQRENYDLYTSQNTLHTTFWKDVATGNIVSSDHLVSLYEACSGFLASALTVHGLPLQEINADTNPAVRHILQVTLPGSQIHNDLNATMHDWFETSFAAANTLDTVWLWSYVGMSLFYAIDCALIFLPVIWSVDRARDAVLHALAELPTSTLRRLRNTAENNVKALGDGDEDEDADRLYGSGIDTDSDNDVMGAWGDPSRSRHRLVMGSDPMLMMGASPPPVMADYYATAGVAAVDGDKQQHDSTTVTTVAAAAQGTDRTPGSVGASSSSISKQRSSKKQQQRSTSMVVRQKALSRSIGRFAFMSLRYVLPMLVLFAFYTALYFMAVTTIKNTRTLSFVALQANTRNILITDVGALVRDSVRLTNNEEARRGYNSTLQVLQKLDENHRRLMFGPLNAGENVGVRAGIGDSDMLTDDENALVHRLLFGDLCEWHSEGTYDLLAMEAFPTSGVPAPVFPPNATFHEVLQLNDALSRCQARLQGSMDDGLHAAYLQYVRTAAYMAERRFLAVVDANGEGNITTRDANGAAVTARYSIAEELKDSRMDDLRNCGFVYLPIGSIDIAKVYTQASRRMIVTFIVFESVLATCFLLTFLLIMVFYYQPQLVEENRQIRKQAGLLLLLPPNVFQQHKHLKMFLLQLVGGRNAGKDNAGGNANAVAPTPTPK